MKVDVHFRFFNPEMESRKLVVGFEAPGTYDDGVKGCPLSDFMTGENGHIIPHDIYVSECADCGLIPIDSLTSMEFTGRPGFVFLFEIEFEPGYNEVSHSYESLPTIQGLFGRSMDIS